MNSALLARYLNAPVVIQLKNPIVGVYVKAKAAAPHFSDPKVAEWLPQAAIGKEGPEATQLLQGAVIREIDHVLGCVEIYWLSVLESPQTVLGTVLELENIAAVTRVVSVTETSSLIIQG